MTAEAEATERAVSAALAAIAPDGPLGLAVSGGGDSTALASIAARWASETGRRLEAATVDHGLREGSRAEAEAAGRACAGLGLAHAILPWADRPVTGNLQAAARAARQRLIGTWARDRGLAAVLLAHTLDDQAETVLMRLARGAGADGLSAMAPRAVLGGTLWLRPCLGVTRDGLRAVLRARGIGWAEDPLNEDPAFERVRARRALAALAPLGITAEGLSATADRLRGQRRVLCAARDALARRTRAWGACGEARIGLPALLAAEEDTALGVLSDTLLQIGGGVHPARHAALARLLSGIRRPGFGGATLAGVVVARQGDDAVLAREPAACAGTVPLAPDTVWDRRWRVRIAGPWPDARIGALGEAGLAALEGTPGPPGWTAAPRTARLTVPAIRDATGALLAVPAAGHRAPTLAPECRIEAEADVVPGLRVTPD